MKRLILFGILLSCAAMAGNEYKQPNDAIFYKTVKIPGLNVGAVITVNPSTGLLGSVGALPVSSGGTGSQSAFNGFNNLSPLTTTGDLIYGASSGAGTRLGGNTTSTKNFLTSTGSGGLATAPSWGLLSASDIPSLSSGMTGILPVTNGGTNSSSPLANNRIMVSSGGTVGEMSLSGSSGYILTSNGSGSLPTWQAAPATGVTSVGLSAPSIFSVSGSPITTSGTLGLSYSGTALPVANGGTNSTIALNNNRFVVTSGGTIGEANPLLANRAVATDSNGLPVHSATTSTELGYLSGVTSLLQTQLNGKQSTLTLPLSVANGGTNNSVALNNNRFMISSGGTISETNPVTASRAVVTDTNGLPTASTVTSTTLAFMDATSSVQTQLNGKQASLTLPLTVANGGTNTSVALANNRMIVSSGGTIAEMNTNGASGLILTSTGLSTTPTFQTNAPALANATGTLSIAKGGTNSGIALNNNRVIVSSGGTLAELSLNGTTGQVLTSNGNALPTWQASVGGMSNPMTTTGDIIYSSSGSTPARLAIGAGNSVLSVQSGLPSWQPPQTVIMGDWKNDLTFTASAGFGTVTNSDIRYKREGDTLLVSGSWTSGTAAASIAYIQLPAGVVVDTTKITSQASVQEVGKWYDISQAANSGIGVNARGPIFYDGSTNNQLFITVQSGTNAFTKDNGTVIVSTGDNFTFEFRVPISGWSSVVPNSTISGSIVTDWALDTQITANSAFGTTTASTIYSRRVGDTLQINGRFTSGTVTASAGSINFGTYRIDTTKIGSSAHGTVFGQMERANAGSAQAHPATSYGPWDLFYDGSTNTDLYIGETHTSNAYDKVAVNAIVSNGDDIFFQATVPISGWTSTGVGITTPTVSSITSATNMSSPNIYLADTTGGSFNVTLPKPASGVMVTVKDPNGKWGINKLSVLRNASEKIDGVAATQVLAGASMAQTYVSDGTNWFSLNKPNYMVARYNASVTPITTSLGTVFFTTANYDLNSNCTNGVCTIVAPGTYHIGANLLMTGATVATSTKVSINILKNGAVYSQNDLWPYPAAGSAPASVGIYDDIVLANGDTVAIQASSNATTPSISASTTKNYFYIRRVGD